MRKLLFVFGTRPEAIKLAPLIAETSGRFDVRVCVTAQHREMLDQVLRVFRVKVHHDLDIMQPGQTLADTAARILQGLQPVLAFEKPDFVIVQGDTTTTFAGSLAAFYAGVRVGHVEAGLRTRDRRHPFPEEINRVLTTRVADIHFAPTQWARENLLLEGVAADTVHVTGNTGIDAVLRVSEALESGTEPAREWSFLDVSRRLLLVTAHRRESFGEGIEAICGGLQDLAARTDVQIVIPVHPNPQIRGPVTALLGGTKNVHLIEPVDYVGFVDLMRRASILITDSGGIQEEGPSLGKPILVMRDKTERPEAVEAGTVVLTGRDRRRIVAEASRLLDDSAEYERRTTIHNPYGNGRASVKISTILETL